MFKKLVAALLLLTTLPVLAAPPIIFSGSNAKLLKPNLDFFGGPQILTGTVDPTSVATSAPEGSLYLNSSNGVSYRKNDAGSTTNWTAFGASAVITAWTTYTPTFTGFGTVTVQDFRWRQLGDAIQIQGSFTSGTSTATEARISLPNSYTSATDYVTIEMAGYGGMSANAGGVSMLIEPSKTYMTIGIYAGASNALTKANGSALITAGSIMSVDALVRVQGISGVLPAPARSEISVSVGNGYGSTNTKVRRFTTTDKSVGTDITYADSATNGASFTINTTGIYGITYSDFASGGAENYGITVNGSALTTAITSVTYAQGKRAASTSVAAGNPYSLHWDGNLSANDVVRPQTTGLANGATDSVMFSIVKLSN